MLPLHLFGLEEICRTSFARGRPHSQSNPTPQTPFYDHESLLVNNACNSSPVIDMLPRLHSLVVGPGLGREVVVFSMVLPIIEYAVAVGIPVVIDADGLFMLETFPGLWNVVQNHSMKFILTPNKAEFDRLCKRAAIQDPPDLISSNVDAVKLEALSQSLSGATVLLKGKEDLISDGAGVWRVQEEGSPRRCGGQGDLLAGSLGVAAYWAASHASKAPVQSLSEDIPLSPNVLACALASVVVKRAAKLAFSKHARGTTTPEILDQIALAFERTLPHT
jgi:ATP-dependent NAD(P)H-hydrate dehydratase